MHITNLPVIANLHDNYGVGTFLLRIARECEKRADVAVQKQDKNALHRFE